MVLVFFRLSQIDSQRMIFDSKCRDIEVCDTPQLDLHAVDQAIMMVIASSVAEEHGSGIPVRFFF